MRKQETATAAERNTSEGIESRRQPLLNLKRYMVGNPTTGEAFDMSSRIPAAHNFGIISDELYEFLVELDINCILDPVCGFAHPNIRPNDNNIAERRSLMKQEMMMGSLEFPLPPPALNCRSYASYLMYHWANNDIVRKALHVREGTVPEWIRCNYFLRYQFDIGSILMYHYNLTRKGYRALVYSGDHDLVLPHIGTQAWIRSLNFSIVDDWRSWLVNGQVGGYTRTYSNNLTFATVKGAGHTVPEYMPEQCLAMAGRWLSMEPL